MQWKITSYISNNNDNVYIRNLSTKSIVNKETSKLSKTIKLLPLRTNMFKFRQRLEYKCDSKEVNYNMIDERYTSKMCSNCGTIDGKLGSKKIYSCKKCKKVID
jgi:putative transposase